MSKIELAVFAGTIIIGLVMAGVIALGIYLVVGYGIERHERAECITWQGYASTIDGFYLTEWQEEQCKVLNVDVWQK